MAAERKLKAEIDRTLKKVVEGQEVFEDLWNQVHDCENPNQREKLEGELKKEIKKLQRLREQVKAWITSADIKDKQPLMDARRSVERDMERFKACERESKIKGINKVHNDPKEKARDEARDWINSTVEGMTAKIEEREFELEELQGGLKKKQKPPPRITELEEVITFFRAHVGAMEKVLRCIDNEAIAPDELEDLKGEYEMFLSEERDDVEGYSIEDMYADLLDRMDNVEHAAPTPVVHKLTKKDEDVKEREREKERERMAAAAATAKAQLVAQGNQILRIEEEETKQARGGPTPQKAAAASPAPVQRTVSMSMRADDAAPSGGPSTAASPRAGPTGLASAGSEPLANKVPTNQWHSGAVGAAGGGDAAQPFAGLAGLATGGGGGGAPPGGGAGPAGSQPSSARAAGKVAPAAAPAPAAAAAAAAGAQGGKAGAQAGTGTQHGPAGAHAGGGAGAARAAAPSGPPPGAAGAASPPGDGAAAAAAGPPQQAGGGGAGAPGTGGSASPPGVNVFGGGGAAAGGSPNLFLGGGAAPSAAAGVGVGGSTMGSGEWPSPGGGAGGASPGPGGGPAGGQGGAGGARGGDEDWPPMDLPVMPATMSMQSAKNVLESVFQRCMPQPGDTDWRRTGPRHPAQVPASFPRQQHPVVDNPALFRRLDPECLFFAFYFQPDSYQQFLAAGELKRQSWRFHKHHHAWFQRFTEPTVTSDEYEQGAYVYFDYNIVHDDMQTGWCYRRKENFTFRYDALEDDLKSS
ncbi:hypothetical protein FOA52_001412 [Chlamydomonas sp. UWO 241]|nr:hypothetical protein FOA52_001412 [Chlamydomonas sp. UWO 241]